MISTGETTSPDVTGTLILNTTAISLVDRGTLFDLTSEIYTRSYDTFSIRPTCNFGHRNNFIKTIWRH